MAQFISVETALRASTTYSGHIIFASSSGCHLCQVSELQGVRSSLSVGCVPAGGSERKLPRGAHHPRYFQELVDTMPAVLGGVHEADHQRNLNLEAVLSRVQEFRFTIKAKECSFDQKQIKYLRRASQRQARIASGSNEKLRKSASQH